MLISAPSVLDKVQYLLIFIVGFIRKEVSTKRNSYHLDKR
nr:MAG TPA: hypothetical protein [Caudoviricetes sp.]